MRAIDDALTPGTFRAARAALRRLGLSRLRESYWTTFWLARDAEPAHPIEKAVLELAERFAPSGCSGMEWWIGRSYTTHVPVGFHFDEDVKARRGLRHPLLSSVLFFNRVRGGQLAVTDQTRSQPSATRLETVKPRPNRYAVFRGDLFHGVLDARGRTPRGPLPGPRGRLRITLVINYWRRRPTDVPAWSESRAYRALRTKIRR